MCTKFRQFQNNSCTFAIMPNNFDNFECSRRLLHFVPIPYLGSLARHDQIILMMQKPSLVLFLPPSQTKCAAELFLWLCSTGAIVGHVGDGNFHTLLVCDSSNDDELLCAKTLADTISKSVTVTSLMLLYAGCLILICLCES